MPGDETLVCGRRSWLAYAGQHLARQHINYPGTANSGFHYDPAVGFGQRLPAEAFQVLKPSLGTKPVVYYKGLRDGVK